jgi:hypothetical protein
VTDENAVAALASAVEDLRALDALVQDYFWRLKVACAVSLVEFVEGTRSEEKVNIVRDLMTNLGESTALLGGNHPYLEGQSIVPQGARLNIDSEIQHDCLGDAEQVATRAGKYVNGAVIRLGVLRDAVQKLAASRIGVAMPYLVSVFERVRSQSCILKTVLRQIL